MSDEVCKNCGLSIEWDTDERSWVHSDNDILCPPGFGTEAEVESDGR